MDLDSLKGLNEIRPSVYRVAMKLQSLQKLCHLHVVSLRHIVAALRAVGGATLQQDVGLNRQEVTRTLNRMFHSASQEVSGHVTDEAPEETCSLMFRLFDRTQAGSVSAASLQTALIALSAETLLDKYRALVSVAANCSGSVSRSGLRSLLQDLSQVPAAVQEEGVFSGVEAAVGSCFTGVMTPMASKEHVLSWLKSEPRLLLWLPTLHRLAVSQKVNHAVRCHTCKTVPITGLRYRCMKCVNVHLCQTCFLTDRQTRKHKAQHPVLEFCTQPTWKESLSSLVHSARNNLLPRRFTQREADKTRILMWAESGETPNSAPPPSDVPTRLAASAVCHSPSSDRDVSHDALVQPPRRSFSSKALQTDEETPTHQAADLLTEVRNLQRDKWLLEEQLQAWRLAVQSEQGILEDRCSEMEVTMDKLREHNLSLQGVLTQALNRMEAQQHANNTPRGVDSETNTDEEEEEVLMNVQMEAQQHANNAPQSVEEDEEEEVLLKTEDEWSEDKEKTPSPTMHLDTPVSYDTHCEEEDAAGDRFLRHPVGKQDEPEEAEPQEENTCLSEEEEKHYGTCSPEELLQETVERLKLVMETDRWRERQTGERKRAELLEAAGQVGDSIHHLVDAVRTNT